VSKLQRAQKALEGQRAYMADLGGDLRGYWQAFGPRGPAYYAQDLADLRLADDRYHAALRGKPFTREILLEHAAARHRKTTMTHHVVHYPRFAFCGTTFGSPAMCDLAIATPAGGTPIVLAPSAPTTRASPLPTVPRRSRPRCCACLRTGPANISPLHDVADALSLVGECVHAKVGQ
jgi:hypothetical protein